MPPPHNNFSMYTLLLISTVLTLVVPSSSFGINSHNFVRLLLIAGMQTIKISIIESAKRRKKKMFTIANCFVQCCVFDCQSPVQNIAITVPHEKPEEWWPRWAHKLKHCNRLGDWWMILWRWTHCFTSTEAMRLIRDGRSPLPQLTHSLVSAWQILHKPFNIL